MDTDVKKDSHRIAYLDYLRVFATLAVVLLHVSSRGWDTADVMGSQWFSLNIYNGLSRWCVLVFAMISGALFLPRDIPAKTLYGKKIRRLATVFFAWAAVYFAAMLVAIRILKDGESVQWVYVVAEGIKGAYHMWYIPMTIGLYMCVPLLRPMVKDIKVAKHLLLLTGVFTYVLPQIFTMLLDFAGPEIAPLVNAAKQLVGNMNMQVVGGYIGVFVAGYVLSTVEIKPKHRKLIYFLGIAGVLVTIGLNAFASRRVQYPLETYLYCYNIHVVATAVAIFVWVRYNLPENGKFYEVVRKFSKYGFGIYLVHPYFIMLMEVLGYDPLAIHPMVSVPLVFVVVTVASFAASFVMNKIPFVREYFI